MSLSLGSLFANLFSHSSQVVTDGEALMTGFTQTYNAVAHGEGGVQKVSAALTQSAAMTQALAKLLADATAAPAAPPAPAP